MSLPVALQLYTVREPMAADPAGTLDAVARIGFQWVEVAGIHFGSAQAFRQQLDQRGLQVAALHTNLPQLESQPLAAVADAKTLGCRYLVCSYLAVEDRDYPQARERLSRAAAVVAAEGITLCYHNHSFEFDRDAQGRTGLEILLAEAGPTPLHAELDIYWVQHGGDQPVAWIRNLAGRSPLLHVKDMADSPDRSFTEVGTGTVDIAAAIAAAQEAGTAFFILEQDSHWQGSPLESAAISYRNFQAILRERTA